MSAFRHLKIPTSARFRKRTFVEQRKGRGEGNIIWAPLGLNSKNLSVLWNCATLCTSKSSSLFKESIAHGGQLAICPSSKKFYLYFLEILWRKLLLAVYTYHNQVSNSMFKWKSTPFLFKMATPLSQCLHSWQESVQHCCDACGVRRAIMDNLDCCWKPPKIFDFFLRISWALLFISHVWY